MTGPAITYLLDTHVFLWLLSAPARVPTEIRAELANRERRLLVSAASALEIAIKVRLGKLAAPDLVPTFPRRLEQLGAEPLPISVEHATLAGSMPWHQRDPFDRILVAQALVEGVTLVTVDQAMADLPAPRIVSW